ncbi:unnamed protein product [Polarella glacialis]|uniref:Uncharacterized protein n=1 Tax=Polarella glacialis TaxID=89957 RepID=A0A813F3C1_POLGL|nr:unnamed protein product [Polarella glacialis]
MSAALERSEPPSADYAEGQVIGKSDSDDDDDGLILILHEDSDDSPGKSAPAALAQGRTLLRLLAILVISCCSGGIFVGALGVFPPASRALFAFLVSSPQLSAPGGSNLNNNNSNNNNSNNNNSNNNSSKPAAAGLMATTTRFPPKLDR